MDWITTWDFAILDWIQAHLRCGAADQFFSTITHLADGGVFWILLAVVLLIIPKTRRFGLALALALVLSACGTGGQEPAPSQSSPAPFQAAAMPQASPTASAQPEEQGAARTADYTIERQDRSVYNPDGSLSLSWYYELV